VTDRQTDGQNYDSQDRASIAASRGQKQHFYKIPAATHTRLCISDNRENYLQVQTEQMGWSDVTVICGLYVVGQHSILCEKSNGEDLSRAIIQIKLNQLVYAIIDISQSLPHIMAGIHMVWRNYVTVTLCIRRNSTQVKSTKSWSVFDTVCQKIICVQKILTTFTFLIHWIQCPSNTCEAISVPTAGCRCNWTVRYHVSTCDNSAWPWGSTHVMSVAMVPVILSTVKSHANSVSWIDS